MVSLLLIKVVGSKAYVIILTMDIEDKELTV